MTRVFRVFGALSAGLAVAAGAFGAHALRERLDPRLLEVFETAARYQMYHALALIALAWWCQGAGTDTPNEGGTAGRGLVHAAGWLFIGGTVLFSGSLYAMALTGARALGAVTPLGGVCFLAGWLGLALAGLMRR